MPGGLVVHDTAGQRALANAANEVAMANTRAQMARSGAFNNMPPPDPNVRAKRNGQDKRRHTRTCRESNALALVATPEWPSKALSSWPPRTGIGLKAVPKRAVANEPRTAVRPSGVTFARSSCARA